MGKSAAVGGILRVGRGGSTAVAAIVAAGPMLRTETITAWRLPVTLHPRYDLWILRSLRRIMRAVDVHSRRLSAEYSITGPQVICLQTIHEDGPMTVTALAKLVHLSGSTVVGIIDRLEQKGWVLRERSRTDRRQILIHATDEGSELLQSVPSPLQDRLARGLAELTEKEQHALAAAIERLSLIHI
jgi:DNA-binding MarR family transcriptional regulator